MYSAWPNGAQMSILQHDFWAQKTRFVQLTKCRKTRYISKKHVRNFLMWFQTGTKHSNKFIVLVPIKHWQRIENLSK